MQTRKADFLWGSSASSTSMKPRNSIRHTVRRYGVKVVAFDNLQLFGDQTLKVMIPLLIIQPNRVQEGTVAAARNADGASQIEKGVDALLCLHRNRESVMKQKELEKFGNVDLERNFSPKLYVRTDLSRFAPGGMSTLWFEGAMSWVREVTPEDAANLPAPQMDNTKSPCSTVDSCYDRGFECLGECMEMKGRNKMKIMIPNTNRHPMEGTGRREQLMTSSRPLLVLAFLITSTLITISPLMAQKAATPPSAHETITPLITKDLAGFAGEEALMYTVDFPPGYSSPVHRHNAQVSVYVLEGSVVMQVRGQKELTLRPGQTFL
jgi:Cupin domain